MLFFIGLIVVFACVAGGYGMAGGHFDVLWQPLEFLIILGAGIGSFILANPMHVLKGSGAAFGKAISGAKYNAESYLELMGVLYSVFKLAKTKGDLALESHVENPHDSTLFNKFPGFAGDHHAVEFLCDYLRLLTLGVSVPHEVEAVMDQELDIHHQEQHTVTHAIQTMADAFPALGIVAAVLGVIHTMGSITEPPEVLGHLIGAALVGTFFGILVSYGVAAPIAGVIGKVFESESKYMLCIKVGIIAHMQGYAPQVSVEMARKMIEGHNRPTFAAVEEMVQSIPSD